jgi:hypothetical protein
MDQLRSGHGNVKQGFIAYVLESLYSMIHVCANQNINLIKKISAYIRLQLPIEKLDINKFDSDEIMFNVMNTWFPVNEAVLHLIVFHLLS